VSPFDLYEWTSPRLREECGTAHRAYTRAKTADYTEYFAAHEELKHADHAYKAKDVAAALPRGWESLAELLAQRSRHRHHLSANSSQILALAILGAASKLEPSHAWLYKALGPLPLSQSPEGRFEVGLDPAVLNEDPGRVTSLDYRVVDDDLVICVECKWVEAGIGQCSCKRAGGDPASGMCRPEVRDHRPRYWETAREVFGLPGREDGQPCPLSPSYQAVRNVAAALELSKPTGIGVFALIYDESNPYFTGCGDWPGWPTALRHVLDKAHSHLLFRAVSWQKLFPVLPFDHAVFEWAATKHGLAV
jgi:hypothetical protein